MIDRSPRTYRVALVAVLTVSLAVRLIFWLRTRFTIEDALIIGRMVRNFVERGELSFNIGERISAATSPLFALMASGIAWLGIDPLTAAKILGLLASTATCLLVFDVLCEFAAPVPAAVASGVCVLLPPIISFSVAGMETALYTLVCFLALERVARGRPLVAVVCGSVATLIRPDGAIVLLVVGLFAAGQCKRNLRCLLACIWPALVLVPLGVVLQALYYHDVVPHSAIAKATAYQVDPWENVQLYLQRMFLTWTGGLAIYGLALLGAARLRDRARTLAPFGVWYVLYHLLFMLRAPLFDWYLHPPLVVLSLFAGVGLLAAARFFLPRERAGSAWAQTIPGAIIAAALLSSFPAYCQSKARMQAYESQVLEKAGKWLSSHTPPDSLVFTESLGYVGFYAGNRFVDWPGLASRNVPTILQKNNIQDRVRAFDLIISSYHPDYLALKAPEWEALSPRVKAPYSVCAEFPTPSEALGTSYLIAGITCL